MHIKNYNWRPRKKLVATLYSHTNTVTQVIDSGNSLFMSGSNDGTICVYDYNQIGRKNRDKPNQPLAQIKIQHQDQEADNSIHKIKTLNMFGNKKSFIVGTNQGLIQLFNLDRIP